MHRPGVADHSLVPAGLSMLHDRLNDLNVQATASSTFGRFAHRRTPSILSHLSPGSLYSIRWPSCLVRYTFLLILISGNLLMLLFPNQNNKTHTHTHTHTSFLPFLLPNPTHPRKHMSLPHRINPAPRQPSKLPHCSIASLRRLIRDMH
jgi:hypothetical protein